MGIPWSAEVAVGEVEGYCDERFIEVKRQFAAQRLAQLCVYVEGQMVVRKIFFQSEIFLRDFCQVNLWQNGGVESYSENTLAPIFSRCSRSKIKKFFMRAKTCSQWKVSGVSCVCHALRPGTHQVHGQVGKRYFPVMSKYQPVRN